MALSTNIHPISTHRVRPRAGLVIDRIWMRRKARGRTAYRSTSLARLLLQLVRLPRRANLREIDHGTGDRSAVATDEGARPNRVPVNLSCQIAVAVGSLAAPRESSRNRPWNW